MAWVAGIQYKYVWQGFRRYPYANHNQRTRKRNHPFHRHAHGGIRGGAAAGQGRGLVWGRAFHGHGHLHRQHDPTVRRQRRLPFREPGGQVSAGVPQVGPYDDLRADCRFLHAGMPDCAGRKGGVYHAGSGVGDRSGGDAGEGLLDHLPQVVLLCHLYRHGLGLRAGVRQIVRHAVHRGFPVAAGGRDHLYCGRGNLRAETAAVQLQA